MYSLALEYIGSWVWNVTKLEREKVLFFNYTALV